MQNSDINVDEGQPDEHDQTLHSPRHNLYDGHKKHI